MTKICCVCKQDNASYKCPTCQEPYCSVSCCKQHKIQDCEPPKIIPNKNEHNSYNFPTEDTVSIDKLQQLRNSEEVMQCLKNPHLRDIMKSILNNANPTTAIALAMTEPIFVELADACLKVVELPDEDKPC